MRMALMLLIAATACAAAPINFIDNPGFEQGLDGWSSGFGAKAVADNEVAHTGGASARLAVEHGTMGLDAPDLTVDYDLYADAGYRASAWIKSGGVVRGDFGGRIYCYGPDNAVMAMYSFGTLRTGAPAGDWKQISIDFGAGSPHPLPPGTLRVRLRFSIWDQEEDATGTIWVDDVELAALADGAPAPAPAGLKTSDAGTVLLLDDDMPRGAGAADVASLAGLLTDAGMAVNLVDAARLAEPGLLNARWVDLVVLPNAPAFPADARNAFVRYALNGGSFMAFGGLAFDTLWRRGEAGWVDTDRTNTDAASAQMLADFEADAAPQMGLGHCDSDRQMAVSRVTPGADGSQAAAKLVYPEGAGWAYAAVENAHAQGPAHSALCFWARGDENTSSLAVELNEDDKSRWKRVVEVGQDWQWYVIPAHDFLSYATEGRGGPGDYLNPQKTAQVWFGLTGTLAGPGPHTVFIDGVQWRRPAEGVGAPVAPMRPGATADGTIKAFGSEISESAASNDRIPVFTPPARFAGIHQLRVAWPTAGDGISTTGAVGGYLANATTRAGSGVKGLRIGGPRAGRLITLLEAVDDHGRAVGPAASIFLPASRRARGAAWVLFGLDDFDVLAADHAALQAAVTAAARIAAGRPAITSAEMRFVPVEGKATSSIVVAVQGAEADGLAMRVRGQAGDRSIDQGPVSVEIGESVEIPLPGLDPTANAYTITAELLDGTELLDSETISVDAERCFFALVDWLVEHQNSDGTYSGVSFEDNRAARGILGAFELTGDEKYRASAIRWGEEMMRLQREDGGYRMGYGIGSKGESCYVADGGEIAIAMTRLISYTEGTQRQRFIDSVRAYMGYREDFREPNGAIGVGWCLHDYGQRPIVPLDVPTRIYAGEKNTYTIGCTLAAATAFSRVINEPEFTAMVLRDTNWLLEHYTSYSGASAESAVWAHHFVADSALKARIEEDLRSGFIERIANPTNEGWLGGEGRSVLDLDIIAYWLDRIGPDAGLQAAKGRWLYALCDADSTSAITHLLRPDEGINSSEYRFLDFAAVAMADTVRPMVSMKEF